MKMKDMAENYEKLSVAPSSQQPYYPTFRVSEKQLPSAVNWKVGKTYKVVVEVKLVSHEQRSGAAKTYQFEMQKIGVNDGKEKE